MASTAPAKRWLRLLHDLAVDAFGARQRLEVVGVAGEIDAFLAAQAQEAAMAQRLVEQPERAVLQASG